MDNSSSFEWFVKIAKISGFDDDLIKVKPEFAYTIDGTHLTVHDEIGL